MIIKTSGNEATLTGIETLTNKTLTTAVVGGTPSSNGQIGRDTTQLAPSIYDNGIIGRIPKVIGVSYGTSDTLTASVITTTPTDFATTFTLPANFFIATGKACRVRWLYTVTTSGTPVSKTMEMRFGTTTLIVGSSNQLGTANSVEWPCAGEAILVATAAAGASVGVLACPGGEPAGGPRFWANVSGATNPVSVATNGQLVITLRITYSTNTAGNSMTLRSLMVEELN